METTRQSARWRAPSALGRPSQPQDNYASCAQIPAEIQANNTKVQELADEQGLKVAQNVAAGVAGVFIWPIWFAMDFKGAASKDVAALQASPQPERTRNVRVCPTCRRMALLYLPTLPEAVWRHPICRTTAETCPLRQIT